MANQEHLAILTAGSTFWRQWRANNPHTQPDLSNIDLHGADLSGIDLSNTLFSRSVLSEACFSRSILRKASFSGADLSNTNFFKADLYKANLSEADIIWADFGCASLKGAHLTGACLNKSSFKDADLRRAHLNGASLVGADLTNAVLEGADLRGAILRDANLCGVELNGANLNYSIFVDVSLQEANITNCSIYGISTWNLNLHNTKQSDLVITKADEPTITVDDLEVAQFIYLLLNNEKIRSVIDTITSKVVLVLGTFTPERKKILDAIHLKLRQHDYLSILFDFSKPFNRDITETVSTLAHIARFIIADITDAKSIPQELQSIIPDLPSVPVQPIMQSSTHEYGMFEHFRKYPWVLETHLYKNHEDLLATLEQKVIAPAEERTRK